MGSRSQVSVNRQLAKQIGHSDEDENNLLRSLGRVSDRKMLRSFLERIAPMVRGGKEETEKGMRN